MTAYSDHEHNCLRLLKSRFSIQIKLRFKTLVLAEAPELPTAAAIWFSGNGIGHINKVTLRRSWLVLGRVTAFGRAIPPATQDDLSCFPQRACNDTLHLGHRGRDGLLHLWVQVWVAGEAL